MKLAESEGTDATFVHTDVTDSSSVAAMVDTAITAFGRLDFAHNNAGMSGVAAGDDRDPSRHVVHVPPEAGTGDRTAPGTRAADGPSDQGYAHCADEAEP